MRYVFILITGIIIFYSCSNKRQSHVSQLNTANLPSRFIFLKTDSNYTLKTPDGAILQIAKNTFGVNVQIEIKEAYSMNEILLAGLSTQSNGRLLKSGGMIYINATAEGKQVSFLKPIKVSIPAKEYDRSMALFKGEYTADSSINWVNPIPLDSSKYSQELVAGKALFDAICIQCHKPDSMYVGPGLKNCRSREPDSLWAYKFIRNSVYMVNTDNYAKKLKFQFGNVVMTSFPDISAPAIHAILDYCDSKVTPFDSSLLPDTDTCFIIDSVYAPLPDTSIQTLDSNSLNDTALINPAYQFSIKESGWYNIDCYIAANIDHVINVSLVTRLNIGYGQTTNVYLCLPQSRLLTQGRVNNGNVTFYGGNDDSIPLLLHEKAMIFAIDSSNNKFHYGVSRFVVNHSQILEVPVKEASEQMIMKFIKDNNLEGQIDFTTPQILTPLNDSSSASQLQIIKFPCVNQPVLQKR